MDTQNRAELCFPGLNTSCTKSTPSWSEAVLFNSLLSSISVLTVALNLLVIISISHFRQLHTPTNIILLSLAVSDFLVGLLLLPAEILLMTACWFVGEVVCSLYHYMPFIITSASVGNMVLISVDRYVAICAPLHYPARVTERRVQLCVCLCWFCSFLYSSLISEFDQAQAAVISENSCYGQCAIVISYVANIVDLILNFFLPITIITVLYMRVFVVAVSQARAMRCHATAVMLRCSVTVTTKKSELKAARTLGVLVVVFLICLCPYYCFSLAGDEAFNNSYLYYFVYLLYFNSCVNPVIYVLYYPWFRKVIKLIITLQILRPGSREASIL